MRSSILLLCAIFFGLHTAAAQAQFNLKGGLNVTQANAEYDEGNIDGETGYQIGLEIRLGDRLYIAPGAYYFKYQSRIDWTAGPIDLPDYEINFEGLRTPLYVGGDLIEGPNWGLRFFAGPNASFVFTTNDGLPGYEDDAFSDILWGFNAGVGVDLGIFTIDLTREWRLNNVFDGDTPEFKDNIAYLSVGLLF